jgi:hypothetical protein
MNKAKRNAQACIATRIASTVRARGECDNIYVTNNRYNMRRFNNTKEITIITFQATLTTMFVVGAFTE